MSLISAVSANSIRNTIGIVWVASFAASEYLGDFSQCACASLLGLADDWKHVGRVPIRFCLHDIHGALAGHSEPGITKGHPARLRSREGLTGARERAFLLGQRREQVPTNGVYGPAETSIRMYVMAAFGPLNPDPHRAVGSYVLILFLCPFCQKRIE